MNWIRKTIILLSKHGLLIQTGVFVFALFFSIGLCITDFAENNVLYALFFGLLTAWNVVDATWMERSLELKGKVKDLEDKLVLVSHGKERLKFELETAQAALEEAQKHRKAETSAETLTVRESLAEAQDTEPRPSPKRPAFKRKPRTKQENENQN